MLAKIKVGLLVLLGVLALIVVFQNLSEVEVHLLFFTATMRLATLITGTLIVGFLMGLIANTAWKMRNWRAKNKAKTAKPTVASESSELV